MVGVKRLIQEAREVEAPISPTDTTVSSHPEAPLAVTSPVPSVETTAQIPDKIGQETTACAPVLDAQTTSNLNDNKDLNPDAIVDDKQCSVESATTQQVSLEPRNSVKIALNDSLHVSSGTLRWLQGVGSQGPKSWFCEKAARLSQGTKNPLKSISKHRFSKQAGNIFGGFDDIGKCLRGWLRYRRFLIVLRP